jgi:putative ABC transport system ATP-binding protein
MHADTVWGHQLLEATGLGHTYATGANEVTALEGVNLRIDPGTFVVVRGRSGSGKTTLLNLLGGLDHPTAGSVRLQGEDISDMDEDALADMRRRKVGFIFQAFGLIPILTAAENVEIPLRLVRTNPAERIERSRVLLELVGLGERAEHRPHELSGGEQQRVAIARALANEPLVLLADEPTGQLDSRTGRQIIDLLYAIVRSEKITAIIATHDPAPSAMADRVIELSDGAVTSDSMSRT